jgi:hypothetical protein
MERMRIALVGLAIATSLAVGACTAPPGASPQGGSAAPQVSQPPSAPSSAPSAAPSSSGKGYY